MDQNAQPKSNQSATPAQSESDAGQAGDAAVATVTTLNRSWLIKMIVFVLALFGFGSWGLYDAAYLYPKRGKEDAQFKEYQYLDSAKSNDSLARASVENPALTRENLKAKIQAAGGGATGMGSLTALERSQLRWLDSLALVGRVSPEFTKIENPAERLEELRKVWATTSKTTELAVYDIPLQWGFCAAGYFGAGWILLNIFRSARKKYRWDPAAQRLTLPDGKSLVPSDLADVDKRKWHKFFCALVPKSGQAIELDLLKHEHLEGWVLDMERTAFPERIEAEEPSASA